MESRIFRAQRSLGYVCNEIPLQIRYIKKHQDTFIITVVGRRFYTYSASKLHLYSISEFHPSDITCLAVDRDYVYTACQEDVRIFKRGVEADFVHCIPNVRLLLPFGNFVIAVAKNDFIVFERETGERYLEIPFDDSSFRISCIAHPLTLLNKILIGSDQGSLQLWNTKTAQKVYQFAGWRQSVSCLENAALTPSRRDPVMGIGLINGDILLHNIRTDETLMRFHQDWGTVTGITFRTDDPSLMITASSLGHLAVWNLELGRLVTQKENVHGGAVTGLKCFPCEPLFATSSPDNSLRIWIMDVAASGEARLLHFKEGHQAPPTRVRFYGEEGATIVSAGKDSCLRSFCLDADLLSFSLGKASFNRKLAKKVGVARDAMVMPPVVEFCAEAIREGGWESEGVHGKEKANIVAIHDGLRYVTAWSYGRRTKCSFRLLHERFAKNTQVFPTSVVITVCGNFCVIGYSTGHVDRFNLQSGLHRVAYGQAKAHAVAVSAVASDSLNEQVFTAGGAEIKFWNFKSGKLTDTLHTGSAVTSMQTYRDNALAAVAFKDFSLAIVDMDIRRITRTFPGHNDSITDMAFSPDSRWLVSSSLDCSIRVWDLSSASLIDSFQTVSPCVSLTFSPTGEYLASAHENDLGIFLWTNKTVYTPITLTSIPVDSTPELLRLPGTSSVREDIIPADEDEEMPIDVNYTSPDQLSDQLLTLSLLPDYRWKNLARQDLIRERNKPKEALRLPEKAPFFLPTIPGLEPVFDVSARDLTEGASTKTKSVLLFIGKQSAFFESLEGAKTLEEEFQKPFNLLAELSPALIESEIRLLSPDAGGSIEVLKNFLRCAAAAIKDGKNQELVQSYLELFLKLHISTLEGERVDREFLQLLRALREHVAVSAKRLEDLLDQSLNVVLFLKHVAL